MTPPLIIHQDVEVVSINPLTKTFSVIVKVHGSPLQLYTPQMQILMARKVGVAVRYLVAEGFMPDPKANEWRCQITGIAV